MSNQVYSNPVAQYPLVNIVASGTVTFFSPTAGLTIYNWSSTTAPGFTNTLTFPIVTGKAITVTTTANAIVSSGALLNNSLSRQTTSLINSISGAAVGVTNYISSVANENAGTAAAAITHDGVTSNVRLIVAGIASNTITWTGVTYVYE
jgi:hypothetical protein